MTNQAASSPKRNLLAVIGATATGKTAIGVELALALDGEVVNGDSRLFYKGMDIATAKPTQAEMKGVPHHLIDTLKPDQNFSLAEYLRSAREVIADIHGRGKLAILVGGSGQYVWALVEGWNVPEVKPNQQLRAELQDRLADTGIEALASQLTDIDPDIAKHTDLRNPRRVIRAIELALANFSTSTEKTIDEISFNSTIVGLFVERTILQQRVIERLNFMVANGWKSELASLLSAGYSLNDQALSGIGYRQMIGHLNGEYDLTETVRLTAVATNRLVRHQHNWFKQNDSRINWFDVTEKDRNHAKSIIENVTLWLAGLDIRNEC